MKPILALCGILTLSACHHGGRDNGRVRIPVPPQLNTRPTAEPSARSVVDPPSSTVDPPPPTPPETNLPVAKDPAKLIAETSDRLLDIFFGYDRSDLSQEALAAAVEDARLLAPILAEIPGIKLVIEGHCDERGSAEYNIALGDRRAIQAAAALRNLGLPPAALGTVSYGKERPQCEEPNESCWRRNRRAHLVLSLPSTPPATLP
jgi:peptidoglycan-associated lipoprotein